MRFKEFLLQEVGTTTSCIAGFRRIAIPLVRRQWPPMIATMFEEDPPDVPGKKVKMQPQVKEATLDEKMSNLGMALGGAALVGSSLLNIHGAMKRNAAEKARTQPQAQQVQADKQVRPKIQKPAEDDLMQQYLQFKQRCRKT